MARNPKIELSIQAKDAATKVLDKIAETADGLSKRMATVTAEADDKASKVLDGVDKGVKGLDGETAEVQVGADDKASDELADIRSKLERMDGEEAKFLLNAEVKDAKKELYSAQKVLISLDDEEAEVEVRADIADARKRLDALDAELGKLDGTTVEPEIDVPDAGGAGADAGSMFGVGAIKGIGAAGIGTAIVSAFNAGMDRLNVRAKLASQLGLVTKDAEKYAKQASDVYANGWGDSVEEVNGALVTVQQQLVATGRVTESEGQKITATALGIAKAFDADVNEVLRSTSQLLVNGLAPDATAALDIVTSGLQNGANQAGDFFDTIDEYSQHFGAMGLSGQEMLTIISDGFANGQRDADKLADAVKEMRLRTTEDTDALSDAYADLGLNADEYRRKILAGGDSARSAYVDILKAIDSVEDPIEKNRLAVELIGTQFEDLGPKGLKSLLAVEGGLVRVAGAAEQVEQNMDGATSEAETFWRTVKGEAGDYAEKVAGYANKAIKEAKREGAARDEVVAAVREENKALNEGIRVISERGDKSRYWTDITTSAMERLADQNVDTAYWTDITAQRMDDAAAAADGATPSVEELAAAQEEAEQAARDHADALSAEADALTAQTDAMRSSADATFALHDAEDTFAETLAEVDKRLKDNNDNLRAQRQVLDDGAKAAGDVADAQVRVAQETAAANGHTLSASAATSVWNGKMVEAARSASGPLKQSIIDYIATVNGIPPEKVSEILADTNYATVAEAQGALDNASRARKSQITAEANTYAANVALDIAARSRTARITVQLNNPGVRVGGAQLRDVGGSVPGGETAIVAERRPEVVNGQLVTTPTLIEGPATINSGQATAGLLNAGGVGVAAAPAPAVTSNVTNNTYITFPNGTPPREVAESIRTQQRREGLTFNRSAVS